MDNFNPFGSAKPVVRSIVEDLMEQAASAFRLLGSNTKEGAGKETLQAVRDGDLKAVHFSVSVGNGRGSTRLELTGDHVAPVREALRGWSPDEDLSELPPAECIRRTIARETDDDTEIVSFKLSLAPNSRKCKIPTSEWSGFLDYMDRVQDWSESALAYYQSQLAEVDAGE